MCDCGSEEGIGSLGVGVTVGFETFRKDAGNRTQVFWK